MKTKILIPIYNDWQSVFKLLENIDLQLDNLDSEVSVLIINDASTEVRSSIDSSFKKIKSVKVLNIKKNQGSTVYLTLEPCSHYGKTPPCTNALIKSKVKKVIYSIEDQDSRSFNMSYKS